MKIVLEYLVFVAEYPSLSLCGSLDVIVDGFQKHRSLALDLAISERWGQLAIFCQAKPVVNTLIVTLQSIVVLFGSFMWSFVTRLHTVCSTLKSARATDTIAAQGN